LDATQVHGQETFHSDHLEGQPIAARNDNAGGANDPTIIPDATAASHAPVCSPTPAAVPAHRLRRSEFLDDPFADQFRVPDTARFRHRPYRVSGTRFQMDRNLTISFEDGFPNLVKFAFKLSDVVLVPEVGQFLD
jgi:hypothetical protein